MNIQIFGTKKCNDTKKTERFFKGERGPGDLGIEPTGAERRRGIKYQFIDIKEKGMSKGEFNSVAQVIKTPVVRNGKQSTLGYQPDVWKGWN